MVWTLGLAERTEPLALPYTVTCSTGGPSLVCMAVRTKITYKVRYISNVRGTRDGLLSGDWETHVTQIQEINIQYTEQSLV